MDQNTLEPLSKSLMMPKPALIQGFGQVKEKEEMKLHFKKRQFYDRTRKMSITSANVKDLENQCALQHHDKFLKKQKANKDAMKKLFFVSCICFVFMACEAVGGYISGSLAILADAAHMFSDVAGFMISFFSLYIS